MLSAQGPRALERLAGRLHAHLTEKPDTDLYSLAHALATTRAPLDDRAVVLADDRETLLASLRALRDGDPDQATTVMGTARGSHGTVFVFPGQGSQWVGMALRLLESSEVFRERIHECAVALAEFTDWSLLDVLKGEPGAPGLDRVDVVQPVLFAVMVSLAAVWESYGVRPDAVAGHSQGEIAAACVAGALTLSDAARVVALRSQALAELAGTGGMVSVAEPVDRVEDRIRRWEGRLTVAAVNSPASVVVSGDPRALDELQADCAESGVRTRRVPVDYASHSPHVEVIRDRLAALLAPVRPRPASVPFYSAVTGEKRDTTDLDGAYWYENLRRPVRLDQVTRALLDSGHRAFIEVSAHPVLTVALDESLADSGVQEAFAFGTLRRDEGGPDRFLAALAQAYVRGLDVSWPTLFAPRPRQTVQLPTYPFQREPYWLDPVATGADLTATGLTSADHPLLGVLVARAEGEGLLLSGLLALRTHPWLADHALAGTPLLPGTAFLELALRAADAVGCSHVDDLTVLAPLRISENGGHHIQAEVGAYDPDGRRPLTIHSRPATDPGAIWTKHAVGYLTSDLPEAGSPGTAWPPPGARPVEHADPYGTLAARGYDYGSAFQGLRALWQRGDEVYAEVELDETEAAEAGRFLVHPALLDAALHPVALGILGAQAQGAVPFAFGEATVHARGADRLRVRLRREASDRITLTATDSQGEPVLSVRSVVLRPLDWRLVATPGDLLHRVEWEPMPSADDHQGGESTQPVVVRVPGGGAEQAVSAVLGRLRDELAGESAVVVVTASGDVAGAAVGGLVRSVQAEYPGRVFLVEADAGCGPEVLAAVVAGGEPHVRLRDGALLVPRLRRAG
ncbi:acyltransferase domain-containing protein, partial [Streptomyces sp. NPDC052020]|uniref:acyltransferase domain-containing protein n=1 Tax=Streptomyces sp. NPDC052020 TaxID=3155677 RepID=UPI0034487305